MEDVSNPKYEHDKFLEHQHEPGGGNNVQIPSCLHHFHDNVDYQSALATVQFLELHVDKMCHGYNEVMQGYQSHISYVQACLRKSEAENNRLRTQNEDLRKDVGTLRDMLYGAAIVRSVRGEDKERAETGCGAAVL